MTAVQKVTDGVAPERLAWIDGLRGLLGSDEAVKFERLTMLVTGVHRRRRLWTGVIIGAAVFIFVVVSAYCWGFVHNNAKGNNETATAVVAILLAVLTFLEKSLPQLQRVDAEAITATAIPQATLSVMQLDAAGRMEMQRWVAFGGAIALFVTFVLSRLSA